MVASLHDHSKSQTLPSGYEAMEKNKQLISDASGLMMHIANHFHTK